MQGTNSAATLAQLDTLPGVGPALAQRILDARPFSSVADLKRVRGVGDKTFAKLKPLITIDGR